MANRWVAVLLLGGVAVSCTPGPAPEKPPKPHPYFPIADGTTHARGRQLGLPDGEIQCTSCHSLDNTTYEQFSCLGCHAHAQDILDPVHSAVGGYQYTSDACYACHRTGSAVGLPTDSSDPTQDVHVTALVPTWQGTTILSVNPSDETLPMRMNHASTQIPAGATSACTNCHADANVGNFYPGQFHASLQSMMLPQPTACSDCHRGSVPQGFVGPVAMTRTPPSGEMRHDAVVWSDAGVPTATPIVTAPCKVCHVGPALSSNAHWSTNAIFHDALADAGSPQPSSCLDCHANSRATGVFDSTNAMLHDGIRINHSAQAWLGDCAGCHTAGFTTWAGGKFHAAAPAQTSCLPCHAAERPVASVSVNPPFDYGTNAKGITHGDGQDCAVCHSSTTDFTGGHFAHGAATVAGTTCVACHSTQRPTMTVSGFDHSTSGTGDCFGCHQSVTSFATYPGDWAGGQPYPGATLMSSTDVLITVDAGTLHRGPPNNLFTSITVTTQTLYNAMLHTSTAAHKPELVGGSGAGDPSTCWHCHSAPPGTTMVTGSGVFHLSLTSYTDLPDGGGPAPVAQPTDHCSDCHSNMRPVGIVQNTNVRAMDHDARFTAMVAISGTMTDRLSTLDCSLCHASPGTTWSDGAFHTKIPKAAQSQLVDCTVCHYPLMADSTQVDVISAASPSYKMTHKSPQLPIQKCDACHLTALDGTDAGVAGFNPGKFHTSIATQPGACVDCHGGVTVPKELTQSTWAYNGDGQWMNHALPVVTAKDCAFCHAADAKNGAWGNSDKLHIAGISPTTCTGCHAQNAPTGLVSSTTLHGALPDQLSHADVNVTAHDCNFCHVQVGIADAGTPAAGKEWEQAAFHVRFTGGNALTMNGSTGRCSNCHLNLNPGATVAAQDHTGFTATSATDCTSCHQWPGTGSPSAPNWHNTVSSPQSLSVGGFSIAQPPASSATPQAGLNGLAHPAIPSGASCTTCHTQPGGGRGAFGYDHALAPSTGCASCHEAGSDLVGTPWTLNAPGATQASAMCNVGGGSVADRGGDTRPVGIATLACSASAASQSCGAQNCALNHFFPSDCGECHKKPVALPATVQTGAPYVGNWSFQHYFGAPAQQSTCCHCHAPPSCRG